jgi:hypothetical protein
MNNTLQFLDRKILNQIQATPLNEQIKMQLLLINDQWLVRYQIAPKENTYFYDNQEDHQYPTEQIKFVSNESLIEAFKSENFDTGWLQPGILRWGEVKKAKWGIVYQPPKIHKFTIAEGKQEKNYKIPLPGLIFICSDREMKIGAVKENPYTISHPGKIELFIPPLPNVNTYLSTCLGGVELEPIKSGNNLINNVNHFFESRFNAHLSAHRSKKNPDCIINLYDELKNQKDYPLDDLISAQFQVDDLVPR